MRASATGDDASCRNGKGNWTNQDAQRSSASHSSLSSPICSSGAQAGQSVVPRQDISLRSAASSSSPASGCFHPPWHVRSRTHSFKGEPRGGEPASVCLGTSVSYQNPKRCRLRVVTAGGGVREAPDAPFRNLRLNMSLLIHSCSHGKKRSAEPV